MPDALILFTRYPTENFVKTRLIPVLGAQKATLFHSCLVQQTVRTLQQLRGWRPVIPATVRFF
jgi:glycosyltransferase A (GT-A) superfamily protein (DUF2064 family)